MLRSAPFFLGHGLLQFGIDPFGVTVLRVLFHRVGDRRGRLAAVLFGSFHSGNFHARPASRYGQLALCCPRECRVIIKDMNKHPFPSNDLSALRSAVWIFLGAVTVLFWAVVAAMVISFFR